MNFKEFLLNEKLSLSTAKEYAKNWNKTRYNDWFDGKYRIYLPFKSLESLIQIPDEIKSAVEASGFQIDDYSKGLASKQGSKNIYKIGSILQKSDPKLKSKFDSDPQRAGSKGDEKLVVISRHPVDIAGMSTDRGWTSCMNVETGQNRKYCSYDIKEGTLIAYLIKSDDKNIQHPIARVLIKPYINQIGDILLAADEKVYGSNISGFKETVSQWIDKKQNIENKTGIFKHNPELYKDTSKLVIDKSSPKDKQIFLSQVKELKNITYDDLVRDHFWLLGAKFKDAVLNMDYLGRLVWESGIWKDGTWKDGIWMSGVWENGTWANGRWKDGTWKDGIWKDGIWKDGIWMSGVWESGVWLSGTWMNGTWMNGDWESGTWESGVWEAGAIYKAGKWELTSYPPNYYR